MWKGELAALEDTEENLEKKQRLSEYIKKGEKCLILAHEADKLLSNLERLAEFEK